MILRAARCTTPPISELISIGQGRRARPSYSAGRDDCARGAGGGTSKGSGSTPSATDSIALLSCSAGAESISRATQPGMGMGMPLGSQTGRRDGAAAGGAPQRERVSERGGVSRQGGPRPGSRQADASALYDGCGDAALAMLLKLGAHTHDGLIMYGTRQKRLNQFATWREGSAPWLRQKACSWPRRARMAPLSAALRELTSSQL